MYTWKEVSQLIIKMKAHVWRRHTLIRMQQTIMCSECITIHPMLSTGMVYHVHRLFDGEDTIVGGLDELFIKN